MDSDSFKRDLVMTGYDNIYYEQVWTVTYGQWFISERFDHDWLWQHLFWIIMDSNIWTVIHLREIWSWLVMTTYIMNK